MSCEEVCEFLDSYIDRELDVISTSRLENHLTECVDCRAKYQQYRQLRDSVKAQLHYFRAPQQLEQRVRARVRAGGSDQDRVVRREWPLHWRGWAIAASVGVLLFFSGVLFQALRRPSASDVLANQVVSNHVRSLMANHLSDVISTDQHTVKPWFNGKLDFAPVVKDLSSEGFPLAGGRLDFLDDRPVAALVYKRRQHTINLFLWPSQGSDYSPRTLTIRGYNLVHWTHSHMTYWAVSDLNATDLGDFARDLEK